MSEPTLKRKRPPTFQHFPLNRAKKLKKIWVDNKKMKSKWKAEKRREGLTTATKGEEQNVSDGEESNPESESEAGDDPQSEISEPEEKPEPKKSTLHPSRAHIHPDLAPKKVHQRRRPEDDDPLAAPPSLRELTRQAYSRDSLHTFKAGRGGSQGRGSSHDRGRGSRGTGGIRGRGGHWGETGRGQPNMKLRMDAMLEKIKQELS